MISLFYEKRGYHDFSFKIFVSRYRKILLEQFSVSENLSKKFLAWEGDITILCRKFLSNSTEKLRSRPLLCFKKILVSKIFMHRKEGEGGIMVLPKIFCLTGPKNFLRGPFCFTKFLVSKNLWIRRGEYHDFLSKIFCLTVPKNFVEEPFCALFQKISGSQKVYG